MASEPRGWDDFLPTAEITVLYVDDRSRSTDKVAAYLERENDRFSVVTAASVSAGLQRLDEHDVDCIVSGYAMPERDGIEFLEAVRERVLISPSSSTPARDRNP